jgi:replicative DNA helicase
MSEHTEIVQYYQTHLPGAQTLPEGEQEVTWMRSECPLCKGETKGIFNIDLDPESLFFGLFNCSALCSPPGFMLEFARRMGISLSEVPGFDPEREETYRPPPLPHTHKDNEMHRFVRMLSDPMREPFRKAGLGDRVLDLLGVGYNGRMFTFPYMQHDDHCYALRCVAFASRFEEPLWQGHEAYFLAPHNLFNGPEVARCDGGTLFVTVGERNALTLAQFGYPVVAIPTNLDDEAVTPERFQFVKRVLVATDNSAESIDAARRIALRLGYKVRMLRWPLDTKRDYGVADLLKADPESFGARLREMIYLSEPLSPLSIPRREYANFEEVLGRQRGRALLGLTTCYDKLNTALDGLRGINILGAQPKTGKSTFFMQVATSLAMDQGVPVIYYDFENGRNKIYTRTLCRMSGLSEKRLSSESPTPDEQQAYEESMERLRRAMQLFKVVSDRKINPDIMRKQIEFLRLDTGKDRMLLVVDSLHKLPFGRLSERRSGIDEWLRNFEQIRDDMEVTFLVVSELSRGMAGGYDEQPDLASFKESGDIEYTADNALVMTTRGSVYDREDGGDAGRRVHLWLVASREMSPGRVAEYEVQFPYWAFKEL